MNWKLGALLLASFVVYEATTRQISKNKHKTHKRGLKGLADYLRKHITNSKRDLNLLDDRTSKDISFLASETEWLKKTKSTPGKKSLRLNLMDDHNIPLNRDFVIGMTPGKRCANLLDESCNNGNVPGTGDDSDWINGGDNPGKRSWNFIDDHSLSDNNGGRVRPLKRCANLLDESCNNGYVPGTGDDSDWINGGDNPGKRSWNFMDDHNLPDYNGGGVTPLKRCANLLDESCNNGYVPGTGDDSDWINGGDNPGKRSWNFMDDHNLPDNNGGGVTPFKRCANLLDESCNNGNVPGTGDDSDWINGGDNPGKRSWNFMDDHNLPDNNGGGVTPFKRCANLLDESCNNGYVPGTGDDSDWINGGDNPGKRSWNFMDNHNLPDNNDGGVTPFKRCANLLDESCNNGNVPGTGDDSDWINGGDNPGKRSWNFMDDHNLPDNNGGGVTPFKRCANLLDESCNNGYVPGTGDDSDWINGGDNPGKRSWNFMDNHNLPDNNDGGVTPFKRCANLLDESCNNGNVPGTGGDSDWINGGDTPGKRSWNFMNDNNLPDNNDGGVTPFKRCANLLDESCNNGNVPGTGDDSDWINGGDTPGKRSWNFMDDHNLPDNNGGGVTPFKRCANLLDESCNNGYVPGTGDDSDWINGGDNPGKREVHSMNNKIPSIRNYFKSVIPGKQSRQRHPKVLGV